ncbi:glycosyltransferase [Paenibacillus yanchengensis]|uniref:Glycosyltransferase n=1 Tax=Paenibacillus yanchengensis TaxID=2035833 RepID=A0ABW4YFQ6_9BACL
MQTKILLASPVNQKPIILAYFLFALHCLEKQDYQLDILFVDDNEDEASSLLLEQYKEARENVTIIKHEQTNAESYYRNDHTHFWNDNLINKVATIKNNVIEYALKHNYDALMLIDSDIMIFPDTINRLFETNKPIISNIFWTKWQQNTGEMPQVWLMDEYSFYRKNGSQSVAEQEVLQQTTEFLHQMRIPGVYEVGGLGACTLIRRSALEKGVNFKRIDNVSFWGEDRHFCIRAVALGIPLHVDTSEPAFHIYREPDLAGAEQYKKKILDYQAQQTKATISLCMVVHNDEQTLERCLHSVATFVDEIIIVDLGSTDRTTQIAASYTNNIISFEGNLDYAAARNLSFSKATQKYVLWLHPDEVLLEENKATFKQLQEELATAVANNIDAIAFLTPSTSEQLSERPKYFHSYQYRLIKQTNEPLWTSAAYEYLTLPDHYQTKKSTVKISRETKDAPKKRYLPIYQQMIADNIPLTSRDQYYYGNELKYNQQYADAIHQYERFLEQKDIPNSEKARACYSLADCYQIEGDKNMQWYALFHSFRLGIPQPEALCRIGAMLMEEKQLKEASYWLNAALDIIKSTSNDSDLAPDSSYWTWFPALQLTLCHEQMGQLEEALSYIELTVSYNNTLPFLLEKQAQLKHALDLQNKDTTDEEDIRDDQLDA